MSPYYIIFMVQVPFIPLEDRGLFRYSTIVAKIDFAIDKFTITLVIVITACACGGKKEDTNPKTPAPTILVAGRRLSLPSKVEEFRKANIEKESNLPCAAILRALGAQVTVDQNARRLLATYRHFSLELSDGVASASVAGQDVPLRAQPFYYDGELMVDKTTIEKLTGEGVGEQDSVVTVTSNTARPEWAPGAITQPLGLGDSPTRLRLPVSVEQIIFKNVAPYGTHMRGGPHIEGLDHTGIYVVNEANVSAWADGVVTAIRENEPGDFFITVKHAAGLWSCHVHTETPLVKVGDRVTYGQLLDIGMGRTAEGKQQAEIFLADENRGYGHLSMFSPGVAVSVADYLEPTVKAQFEAEYQRQVMDNLHTENPKEPPQFAATAAEPYLTNPLLIHWDLRGTVQGEWILSNPKAIAGKNKYDLLILQDIDNGYFQGKRFIRANWDGLFSGDSPIPFVSGSYELDELSRHLTLTAGNERVYGLFALDESGPRSKLTIEFAKNDFPAQLSTNAYVFYERLPVQVQEDQEALVGVNRISNIHPISFEKEVARKRN